MAILEIGDNFQDALLIHKLVNKIFLAGRRTRRSLAQAISDFDDYYEIFDPASVNKLDRVFFSNEKWYYSPYPSSRIHIHDLSSYIRNTTHMLVDELSVENADWLFPHFEKIIFIDRGCDPRSMLVQEASTNENKEELFSYIHENYIGYLQTWMQEIQIPKIQQFGDCDLFGIFYEEIYYRTENLIKRLSKFFRIELTQSKITELAVWVKANLYEIPDTPNWEDYFTLTQKFSTNYIFKEMLQAFDLPLWNQYIPLHSTTVKVKSLVHLPHKITKRRAIYQFVTNRRIVQALIKRVSKTTNSH